MGKVIIVMGSKSDLEIVRPTITTLDKFKIEYEVNILSAHRTPKQVDELAQNAVENGVSTIIACAGKSAHLAGVIAAKTTLPVIALPIKTSFMGGIDSLLSIVQMPSGIPVATVGVNASENAAILAAQIIGVSDIRVQKEIREYKQNLENKILNDNKNLKEELKNGKA